MQLYCPEGVGSINIGGTEYTGQDGVVTINDPSHIAAAQANGFTAVDGESPEAQSSTGE